MRRLGALCEEVGQLDEQLRPALDAGDVDRVSTLRALIDHAPARIKAAELAMVERQAEIAEAEVVIATTEARRKRQDCI